MSAPLVCAKFPEGKNEFAMPGVTVMGLLIDDLMAPAGAPPRCRESSLPARCDAGRPARRQASGREKATSGREPGAAVQRALCAQWHHGPLRSGVVGWLGAWQDASRAFRSYEAPRLSGSDKNAQPIGREVTSN